MPPKRKSTIHEVAQLAQVGIGTVSRVLNNHPSVRSETRARIQQAMRQLGYNPNPHARRVAGGKSYTVSVMVPFVATEFFSRLLDGIESVLTEERYDLAIFPLLSQRRLQLYLQSHTLAYQTDGLIVSSLDITQLFEGGKLPTDRPIVVVDGKSDRFDSSYVDNRLGGQMAAEYLLRFPGAMFAVTLEEDLDRAFTDTVFSERIAGFRAILHQHHRPLPANHVYVTRFSAEGGRLALQQFMQVSRPPYNIFAGADLLALGILEEARRHELRLGEDLRVLGYDGQPWTEAQGLSTLAQPVEQMGAAAARFLLDRINGNHTAVRSARFEPKLVERASTLVRQAAVAD
jgi:LacI family transcriptional regulator